MTKNVQKNATVIHTDKIKQTQHETEKNWHYSKGRNKQQKKVENPKDYLIILPEAHIILIMGINRNRKIVKSEKENKTILNTAYNGMDDIVHIYRRQWK